MLWFKTISIKNKKFPEGNFLPTEDTPIQILSSYNEVICIMQIYNII